FECKDESGNAGAASAYTEDAFSFVFNDAFNGTLTLQNTSVPDASMTYHITAEECTSELPIHTDTIRFSVQPNSTAWATNVTNTLKCTFSQRIRDGIRVEWVSEGNREELPLNNEGYCSHSITDRGQVYIYYTYSTTSPSDYQMRYRQPVHSVQDLDINVIAYPFYGVGGGPYFDSLDVSGCVALNYLNWQESTLTSLNICGCTALKMLYCNANQLTSLDVRSCTALVDLNCFKNPLTSLDVSHNIDLKNLSCLYNQLTSLDVSHNVDLRTLGCSGNQLTSLDVSANTKLTSLQCAGNQLNILDVSNNDSLSILTCGQNHIPLSTLDSIYRRRANWTSFHADNQTDTITVAMCHALDLSSESPLGGVETSYELKDEAGNAVSAGAYTENGFVFQFNTPAPYTL
ncbi:MAG: hypothetical protein K2I83_03470, partial [Bacteroidales bacterium]|nr:hypothetical protein [Bacteroidales bacterium]